MPAMDKYLATYSLLATAFFVTVMYPSINGANWIYVIPLIFLFGIIISMPLWLDWFE
ncbi:MAG: hypothetical protein JRH13_00385 [Deltaproteobacteria bacterium]|nr:hypothetical protein [Deltaproteobacteria bacterium]MBW2015275.1 hypothetical protein [Deltaproteobacteria bacterium]MBW2127807.1 hypothetical protein [Deltaproteobacteria bacterium]MBW2302091.1 hypothetical protein [Deltaproteobacteria bacterium]